MGFGRRLHHDSDDLLDNNHLMRFAGRFARRVPAWAAGQRDLRKLRGKDIVHKPGRSRRYHVPGSSARTVAALPCLRDHVIAPILAGVRSPRQGPKPAHWTAVDRDYETLRIGMQTLFGHLGVARAA